MNEALSKILLYTLASFVFGAIAVASGKKRARRLAAGDMSALRGLPAIKLPTVGADADEDPRLDEEAARVACTEGFEQAAWVYYRAQAGKDKVRRKYLGKKGQALMKAHCKEKSRAVNWMLVPLAISAAVILYGVVSESLASRSPSPPSASQPATERVEASSADAPAQRLPRTQPLGQPKRQAF